MFCNNFWIKAMNWDFDQWCWRPFLVLVLLEFDEIKLHAYFINNYHIVKEKMFSSITLGIDFQPLFFSSVPG